MIAALFVETGGSYFGLDGVDPWDERRDARLYVGSYPVVAHPPCDRWCQMAPVNQARYGHRVGDDAGCFAAALEAVRQWGGILEHPAISLAWPAFDLPRPPSSGGWVRGLCGGWSAQGIGQLSKKEAKATPELFRDLLISIARTAASPKHVGKEG